MNYSNEYIAELLKDVFNEKLDDVKIPETITRLPGKIPDIVLNFYNNIVSPNGYKLQYTTGLMAYTDSQKDHGIMNVDNISEDCTEYKPFLFKTSVYTNEKCSLNLKNKNGFSLVINSPIIDGEDFTGVTDDLTLHACGEMPKNEHLYLLQPGEDVTSNLFKNITADKVIAAFNSDVCDDKSSPFTIDILTKDSKGNSVIFKNDSETNKTNEGYCVGNICVDPCVDGENKPFIKYNNDLYGKYKYHAGTGCSTAVGISLDDNPTKESPWIFHDFASYTKYTNYTDNPARTPSILVPKGSTDANLNVADNGKYQVDGKNISNANNHILDGSAGYAAMEPDVDVSPLYTGNFVITPCDGKRPYIWYRDEDSELHPLNQTKCPTAGCKITLEPNDEISREFPWKIKETCLADCNNKRDSVAYVLISDYLTETESDDGLFEGQTANSLSYGNLFSVNYGTDAHGMYYHANGLKLEELDKNRMMNEGTVITKVTELCNDNMKLTLLRLENQCDSIIFYRNVYNVDTDKLIKTEEYDLTAPCGKNDRNQALYLLSKHVDNQSREVVVNLTEKLVYTNADDDVGIAFSTLDIPMEIFLSGHEMNIGCCCNGGCGVLP